jgi:hypothetical protein
MINSKRGLSDIVTNVLIILLVLVAVGIIWYFVQPFIRQGAQGIEGSKDCLTISVTPLSCSHNTTSGNYTVVVNRDTGAGNLQSIKLIFGDGTNTKVITRTTTMSEFESATYMLTSTDVPISATELSIAAVATVQNDPDGRTCDAKPTKVTCSTVA